MDEILIKVNDSLYLGNSNIASNFKILKERNINHIVLVGKTYINTSDIVLSTNIGFQLYDIRYSK